MPLYEYQCDACGHRFEVIQKFSDPPVEVCSACGGAVRKLLSSPAIQFKGSGWYITDYARKDRTEGGASQSGEKDGAKSAPSSSSDSSSSSPAATAPAGASSSKDS